MDNLSHTNVILSKYRFIPHYFRHDAQWNLWSSGSNGSLDIQQNGAAHQCIQRRWLHIHAFIRRNTIALRVQRFAAGANIICLTYTTDWWAVIGPVIHGESKSQAIRSSSDHVGLLHTLSTIDTQRVKTRGASCIGGFGQTDGLWKFELGIPQSHDASYIRGASYIRDKTGLAIYVDSTSYLQNHRQPCFR